jgi:nucleotide-binding universal stress UspA family protein
MNNLKQVLLASHGTQGAMAAVSYALKLCEGGAELHHLIVVPSFWKDMMGDDWLNNGVSRDRFGRYIESELGREIDQHIDDVQQQAEALNVPYSHEIRIGEPHECLLVASVDKPYDVTVLGSQRPKGASGVNSKMSLDVLSKKLMMPFLVIPFPQ